MHTFKIEECGPLIIFGGEGVSEQTYSVWEQILEWNTDHDLLLCSSALSQYKLAVREYRLNFIRERLSEWGFQIADGSENNYPEANYTFLVGGRPDILCEIDEWESIVSHHQNGSALIAAAGSATALGKMIFIPPTPPPETLDTIVLKSRDGLRYLPFVILPFYDVIPSQLLKKMINLAPDRTIIGLDTHSALIASNGQWKVAGSGQTTVFQDGLISGEYSPGESVPDLV